MRQIALSPTQVGRATFHKTVNPSKYDGWMVIYIYLTPSKCRSNLRKRFEKIKHNSHFPKLWATMYQYQRKRSEIYDALEAHTTARAF